jgi:heme A synthase
VYELLTTIHNATGGLTLIATLIAALTLLITARTSSTGSALALRADLILASLQGLLGIVLVVLGFATRGSGYIAQYWFHYLLGLTAVGVVSVMVARARRAPNNDARRYGGILLGVFVLVLVAFLAGQFRNTLL